MYGCQRYRRCTLLVLAATMLVLLAGTASSKAAPKRQAGGDVIGIVFADSNENGVYDEGEFGIEGVSVSNGLDVVQTDAAGRYSLPVVEDTVYFVTKPAGYMVPVDENLVPRFYYVHYPNGSPDTIQEFRGIEPTGDLPESVDFPLYPLSEEKADGRFTLLAIGDMQVQDYQQLAYLRDDVIADIAGENAFGADFAIALGDMLTDQLTMYSHYQQVMGLAGIPTFYVPGNHDMDVDAIDDAHHLDTYISHFGPPYYSFDHGSVHFVVLDNIKWLGATPDRSTGNFTDGLSEHALAWLANDLANVPKDKLLVLAMHIPFVTWIDAPKPMTPGGDRDALYALVADYEVLALTAHAHISEVHLPGDELEQWGGPLPFTEIIAGAACGGWWAGPEDERGIPIAYQRDGAPNGYFVIDYDGSDFAPRYKGADLPSREQMHVSMLNRQDLRLPDKIVTSSELGHTQLVVNVWSGSTQTEVICRFDNGTETMGTRTTTTRDPYAIARQENLDEWMLTNKTWHNLFPPVIRAKIGPENWMLTNSSWHLWTCPVADDLEPGAHRATVIANDSFGQTFTEPYLFEVWATD